MATHTAPDKVRLLTDKTTTASCVNPPDDVLCPVPPVSN